MFKLEEGWLTVLLICALVFISAAAVEACQWSDGLWAGWATGFFGILAGLTLAKSQFDGKTAVLFATAYGLVCVGFFIGFMLPGDWHTRSVSFVLRMSDFIIKLILGGASRDALPFPVLIASLFWIMGAFGTWMMFRRHSIWPAILPSGIMLVINAYYYQGPVNLSIHLALYVLVALLLLGHTSLLQREREWRTSGVTFNPEMRLEFLRAGLVVALAGTFVAWATPSIQASPMAATLWQQTNGYWSTVRETWMRMFSSLRGYGQTSNDFYGDLLALGGPSLLTDTPIMDITVAAVRGETEASQAPAPARYYWRATTFERYQNGQWQLGEDSAFREVQAGGPVLPLAPYRLRRDVTAVFSIRVLSTSRLYVVPQPKLVALANNISAIYTVLTDLNNTVDPTVVRARDVLAGNRRTYRAVGSMSVADEESLRASGTDYPLWVIKHYLQLPPEITDRTRQLAHEIVDSAGARTPYDQAQAVTNWLRANITYDTQIQAPPPSQEPVDWFLFTSRRGYCNYYASGEVVLLRSLGIPARLAAGFSQGEFEESTNPAIAGIYHVEEKNAHAWVEVFFPAYGWVEFEPTASEAPLVRPARPAPAAPPVGGTGNVPTPAPTQGLKPDELAKPTDTQTSPFSNVNWVAIGQITVVVAGLAFIIAALALGVLLRFGLLGWESLGAVGAWAMRSRHLAAPSPIGAIYLRLERAARWLSVALPATLTPHERAEVVSQLVPPARPGVETITAQYVQEQYSGHPADAQPARAAWRAIRFKVWREGLRRFIRSFIKDDETPRN
jgi:transglutaminase-like putative cysteine protease